MNLLRYRQGMSTSQQQIFNSKLSIATLGYTASHQQVAQLLNPLTQGVFDKPQVTKLILSCILAGGPILLDYLVLVLGLSLIDG